MRAEFKDCLDELPEKDRDNHDLMQFLKLCAKKSWKFPTLKETDVASVLGTIDKYHDDGDFPEELYPYLVLFKASLMLLICDLNENQWVYHIVKAFVACFNEQNPLDAATKKGRLDWVQFARKIGHTYSPCTSRYAIKSGNLELLKWILGDGAPCDDVCQYAIKYGQQRILEEFSTLLSDEHARIAAECGNLAMFKYVAEKVPTTGEKCLLAAAGNGHLEIVECLYGDNEYTPAQLSFSASRALLEGHQHIAQWLVGKGVTLKRYALTNTLLYGDVAMCKWVYDQIRSQGDVVEFHVVDYSSLFDEINLATLKWLHRDVPNAFPLDNPYICGYAARSKNLTALRFLREIGCSWDKKRCLDCANFEGMFWHKYRVPNPNMVEWILEQDD
jgi:hypothetical protein